MSARQTQSMAVFCDFENVALGVRDAKYDDFDMKRVLERLLLKGNIVVRKAYCDWQRYKEFKGVMHEAAFELIEIPHVRMSGKNSADIRMVVDALDLCYTKAHVDTFVIVSGDSDFSPLVSKLRENNKTVIGVGVKNSSSDLLINNCDEFIYYDDLVRDGEKKKRRRRGGSGGGGGGRRKVAAAENGTAQKAEPVAGAEAPREEAPRDVQTRFDLMGDSLPRFDQPGDLQPMFDLPPAELAADEVDGNRIDGPVPAAPAAAAPPPPKDEETRKQEALDLVLETIEDLFEERGDEDKVWGSMVKQTLKRRHPGFNETYHGFKTFSKLLEEAEARKLITLEHDEKSGGYVIKSFAHTE